MGRLDYCDNKHACQCNVSYTDGLMSNLNNQDRVYQVDVKLDCLFARDVPFEQS